MLSQQLTQMLHRAAQDGCMVTVVFIDLDNFKLINDSLGHHAGDDLLRTVAHRMLAALQPGDSVVRLGGDEFVVVLYNPVAHPDGLDAMIERIRQAVLAPVRLGTSAYHVSSSMGLASYPADGDDAETLLMNADAAMYRAKGQGRNNYQYFTPEMGSRVVETLKMQDELRQALQNGELTLLYQPQVYIDTGHVFGVEALLRWEHPRRGTILPADFLPFAETSGLIAQIDDWVLHTACLQNKAWQDAGLAPITISVNVSGTQFSNPDWVARVSHALAASGLAPEYLEIEVSERAIMQAVEPAMIAMRRLQALGVHLAIDDFGFGYASLRTLRNDPVVRLKIDQSLIRDVPQNASNGAMARAVMRLGRKLNLNVIAEGVETPEQWQFLREHACREVQGYHYSRPVSAQALALMLSAGPAHPGGVTLQGVPPDIAV